MPFDDACTHTTRREKILNHDLCDDCTDPGMDILEIDDCLATCPDAKCRQREPADDDTHMPGGE